jgi:hypothetical protein
MTYPVDPPPTYQPPPTPYVPGYPTAFDQGTMPGPPRKSRKLLIILAAVGAFFALVIAGIVVAALRSDTGIPIVAPRSPFETAQTKCDQTHAGTRISDGGKTLLVDTVGGEDYSGIPITGLACLVNELEIPSAVVAHIDSTRALDGRQEDEWDGFTASWSYHPDEGLDMIVRAS